MNPIVAMLFVADRMVYFPLYASFIQVLCAKTGKTNFGIARVVFRCAVLLFTVGMVLWVNDGVLSLRFGSLVLSVLIIWFMTRGFRYESQKLPMIEREVELLTRETALSESLLKYWHADRINRVLFFFLALGFSTLPMIIIFRGGKLGLIDISFITMSIFWLTYSFYFYVLYHPLSVPTPTETEE